MSCTDKEGITFQLTYIIIFLNVYSQIVFSKEHLVAALMLPVSIQHVFSPNAFHFLRSASNYFY